MIWCIFIVIILNDHLDNSKTSHESKKQIAFLCFVYKQSAPWRCIQKFWTLCCCLVNHRECFWFNICPTKYRQLGRNVDSQEKLVCRKSIPLSDILQWERNCFSCVNEVYACPKHLIIFCCQLKYCILPIKYLCPQKCTLMYFLTYRS